MDDKIKNAYRQSKSIYNDVLTQSKWWSRLYIRFFWDIDDVAITEKLFEMLPVDFSGALLDVPCGTMNLTAAHYQKLDKTSITGLDYSEDMLAGARDCVSVHGLSNVSVIQGDVGRLPFSDETFDAVLSMNGFHVFPDKPKAFSEAARVLKSGGLFFGCFYVRGQRRRSDFVVNRVLAKKGWFTPPFQTKEEALSTLQSLYSSAELFGDKAMVWFRCIK